MDNIRGERLSISDASTRDVEKSGDIQQVEIKDVATGQGENHVLAKKLKSRHMQMIAIGGSIGAGLFVGSGSALRSGGPASVLICFMIIGVMLLCTMQALGELAVLYPVNGAFYSYAYRFVDKSWGFAMGWNYALGWLIVLPFELTAASITIEFWRTDIHVSVWVAAFLVLLCLIQIFGVRGYGEVEFALSCIKICACVGFIIFGIVVNCGGVPTDTRGYIGFEYWRDPGAFRNGFKGFCTVFVTAAFAFGGTELVGLAAAEAENPGKSLPTATKQVFWRISFFYIVTLFVLGLILPSDDPRLMGASGANTKASPFVLAIQMAGVPALPSVFNAVITISVISVANSCTFASSRTMQALAANGMGPRFLGYIDKAGRPLWCLVVQLIFGLIAFVGETGASGQVFTWLLSLTALSFFFAWASINLSHIRFRAGWKYHGYTEEQLPYRALFGVYGSYLGFSLNCLALIATFYTSLFPLGGKPNAETFFANYMAAPIVLAFYVFWKLYSRDWSLYIRAADMDVTSGLRPGWDARADNEQNNKPAWRRFISGFI